MFNYGRPAYKSISVHDLKERLGKVNLIDIREEYEYRMGFVPTAQNVPMGVILSSADQILDKSQEYHIICQSGGRSANACGQLAAMGYNVINVSGGTGTYLMTFGR